MIATTTNGGRTILIGRDFVEAVIGKTQLTARTLVADYEFRCECTIDTAKEVIENIEMTAGKPMPDRFVFSRPAPQLDFAGKDFVSIDKILSPMPIENLLTLDDLIVGEKK